MTKKKYKHVLLIAICLVAQATARADDVETQGITAIVRKYFTQESEGGLALLVIKDNAVIHSKGYGRKYGETPITAAMPMPLASITKQFTAMCAAMLIEEGRLNLTDKVSKYLPELQFSAKGRELLIQDLIWHINGLPNFIKADEKASIERYKKKRSLERLTNKTHAEWLATLSLRRAPGLKFEYTNSGYVLLTRIIEVITENPFHKFQQERIFDVLGMVNTTDSITFNGSGNMMTSLEDYAKWDRALWDDTLISNATSKLLFQSGRLDDGTPVGYGFGWKLKFDNEQLIETSHDGVGSSKSVCRNRVARDTKNRITVALFVRENRNFDEALRMTFTDEVRDYVRGPVFFRMSKSPIQ